MLFRTKEFGDLLQQYQEEIDTFRDKEVYTHTHICIKISFPACVYLYTYIHSGLHTTHTYSHVVITTCKSACIIILQIPRSVDDIKKVVQQLEELNRKIEDAKDLAMVFYLLPYKCYVLE